MKFTGRFCHENRSQQISSQFLSLMYVKKKASMIGSLGWLAGPALQTLSNNTIINTVYIIINSYMPRKLYYYEKNENGSTLVQSGE